MSDQRRLVRRSPGIGLIRDLVSAALAGAGLVRVPSWQVAHCLADGRLRIVLAAYQRPPAPLRIPTLRNRLLLPKVRAFVDFLQQHCDEGRRASRGMLLMPFSAQEQSRVFANTRE